MQSKNNQKTKLTPTQQTVEAVKLYIRSSIKYFYKFEFIFSLILFCVLIYSSFSGLNIAGRPVFMMTLFIIGYLLITGLTSKTTFYISLFNLVLCPILLIFKYKVRAENIAIYAYMLLVIGLIQIISERIGFHQKIQATKSKLFKFGTIKIEIRKNIGLFLGFLRAYIKQRSMTLYHKLPLVVQKYIEKISCTVLQYFLKPTIKAMKDCHEVLRLLLSTHNTNHFKRDFSVLLSAKKASLLKVFLASLLLSVVGFYLTKNIISKVEHDNNLRLMFYIHSVHPSQVIQADQIKLKGYNLGIKHNIKYKIASDTGPIEEIQSWNVHEINFVVPINMPLGKHKIWLEKPLDESFNDEGVIKSNSITIIVYPRFKILPINQDIIERMEKKVKRFIFYTFPFLDNILFIE